MKHQAECERRVGGTRRGLGMPMTRSPQLWQLTSNWALAVKLRRQVSPYVCLFLREQWDGVASQSWSRLVKASQAKSRQGEFVAPCSSPGLLRDGRPKRVKPSQATLIGSQTRSKNRRASKVRHPASSCDLLVQPHQAKSSQVKPCNFDPMSLIFKELLRLGPKPVKASQAIINGESTLDQPASRIRQRASRPRVKASQAMLSASQALSNLLTCAFHLPEARRVFDPVLEGSAAG